MTPVDFKFILHFRQLLIYRWVFLLVKMEKSGKTFVSFPNPKKLSSLLVYVLHVWHWLLLYHCLLTKSNNISINIEPYWSINLLIDDKSLSGFTEIKLYSTSIIFTLCLTFIVYCSKREIAYFFSLLPLWSSCSSLYIQVCILSHFLSALLVWF